MSKKLHLIIDPEQLLVQLRQKLSTALAQQDWQYVQFALQQIQKQIENIEYNQMTDWNED